MLKETSSLAAKINAVRKKYIGIRAATQMKKHGLELNDLYCRFFVWFGLRRIIFIIIQISHLPNHHLGVSTVQKSPLLYHAATRSYHNTSRNHHERF